MHGCVIVSCPAVLRSCMENTSGNIGQCFWGHNISAQMGAYKINIDI